MIMLLFEDSKKAKTSILMKRVLGKQIEFAESCVRVWDEIKSYVHLGYYIVALVDVVPDNPLTYLNFMEIQGKVIGEGLPCTVLPIPCFEYYMILAYKELLEIKPEYLALVLRYAPEYKDINGLPGKVFSFERYCKYVLNAHKPRCFGVYKDGTSDFYDRDCMCSNCKYGYTYSLDEKAWQVIRKLPLFPADKNPPFGTRSVVLEGVQEKCIRTYNNAAVRFGEHDGVQYQLIRV